MKSFVKTLLGMWQQLQNRLVQIGQQAEAQKYSAVRAALRIEAIDSWRQEARAAVESFKKVELPKLREKRAADVTAGLLRIRQGMSPADGARAITPNLTPAPALPDGGITRDDPRWNQVTEWRGRVVQEAILGTLQAVAGQLVLQNAFNLANLQPTEVLTTRIRDYLEAAAPDSRLSAEERAARGAEFDFAGWGVDSIVIRAVLQGRATAAGAKAGFAPEAQGRAGDSGDPRAGFGLEMFDQVEEALIARFFPDTDTGEYWVDAVTEALNSMLQGETENLGAAERVFGRLQRAAQRDAEFPVETLKPPKPKPITADVNDLLARAVNYTAPPPMVPFVSGGKSK